MKNAATTFIRLAQRPVQFGNSYYPVEFEIVSYIIDGYFGGVHFQYGNTVYAYVSNGGNFHVIERLNKYAHS